MSGDEPFAGHEPTAVLMLSLIGIVATVWLTARGIRQLIHARTTGTPGPASKTAATMAWAAAVGMYTWGVLHFVFLDDTDQAQACNEAVGTRQITGYDPSFLPLSFGCRTGGGNTIEAVIPSYLNPAVVVLALCAVVLTALAIAQRKEVEKK